MAKSKNIPQPKVPRAVAGETIDGSSGINMGEPATPGPASRVPNPPPSKPSKK